MSLLLIFMFAFALQDGPPPENSERLENELSQQTGNQRRETLVQLTRSLVQQNPAKAIAYGTEALQLKGEKNEPGLEAELHNLLARANILLGEYSQARNHVALAELLANSAGEQLPLAMAINLRGNIHWYLGEYNQALDHYKQALEIRRSIEDWPGISSSLNNIGNVYIRLGEQEQALKSYLEALKVREAIGNKPGIVASLNNIGVVYRSMGQYEDALKFYHEVMRIHRETGNKVGEAMSLCTIGSLLRLMHRHQEARTSLTEGLQAMAALGNQSGIATAHYWLGELEVAEKNYEAALTQYQRALEIREAMGSPSLIAKTLNSIASTYLQQGRPEEAANFLDRAAQINRGLDREIESLQDRLEDERQEKEIEILRKDNEIKTLEVARQRLIRNGTLIAAFMCLIIIALIVNRAEQKRRWRQERRLNQLKDDFLAITSHELRTPLNGIVGISESLLNGAGGEISTKTRHDLAMIANSGRRLTMLVNDILDFSVLKNGELEINQLGVDLSTLTDIVVTLSRPLAEGKHLQILNQIPKNFPKARGDENRLQQIMHNLIGNAVRFSKEGEIRIFAESKADMLEISVQDQGPGIDPSDHERVFESFIQLHNDVNTRLGNGTGLGLAITRQLVALHGGKIWLTSRKGEGATFTFSIPKAGEDHPPSALATSLLPLLYMEESAIQEPVHVNRFEPGAPSAKILIVDDELVNRQVLLNHLARGPYQLVEAVNGHDALNILVSEGDFDLVLLDIMMPGMSGFEVCREIRESFGYGELAVIFLSARRQIDDLVSGFRQGANDYLTKPISGPELHARVGMHLQLLDINRTLERHVSTRTIELEEKNKEILRTQKQLVQAEKMAALGQLVAGMAHELNTPLGISITAVSHFQEKFNLLAEQFGQESLKRKEIEHFFSYGQQALPLLTANLKKAANLMDNFKLVAIDQIEEQSHRYVVYDRIQQTIQNIRNEISQSDLEIIINGPSQLVLDSYPGSFSQIITNLLTNVAFHAFDPGQRGKINIDYELTDNQFRLTFADNGKGIAPDHLPKIFDPFFTTRRGGEKRGPGLGLHITFNLVSQRMGGTIRCDSTIGKGTTFHIEFPYTQAE